MIFANAWILLLGVAATAIPIAMHLLARHRPKPTPFPTIRWLSETMATHRRRMRLKHWLLLALRVAAVLWLATAFAQPSVAAQQLGHWIVAGVWAVPAIASLVIAGAVAVSGQEHARRWILGALTVAAITGLISTGAAIRAWVQGQGSEPLGDEGPVAALLILDVAPRMEYRQAGASRLEQAVLFAEEVLSQLPVDSRAAIVPSGGGTPFFAVDISAAQRQLQSLEIRPRHVELPERILEAMELFDPNDPARKEIYVFTDRSRPAWPEGRGLDELRRRVEEREASLYLIDVRAESDENVRLGNPKLQRESVTVPGVLELQIDVARRGPARTVNVVLELEQPDSTRPIRRDEVTLLPEQKWTRSAVVELAENGTSTVSFSIPDLPEGVHQGKVALESGDALSFDDRRFFTLLVRPAWRGLVLSQETSRPEILTEAISPSAERLAGRAAFSFEVLDPKNIGQQPLSDFDALFLIDPPALDPATWELLREYVIAGGGLAVFMGPAAEAVQSDDLGYRAAEASFRDAAAARVLPGAPTEVWDRRRDPVALAPADFSHPLLSSFRGMETTVPWRDFPIRVHWGWDLQSPAVAESDEQPEVSLLDRTTEVMRYTNGMPAIIERRLGEGRVVVWTAPIGEMAGASEENRWSRLTVGECWPYFLLANRLAEQMVEVPDSRVNRQIGDVVELIWEGSDAPETLTYFPPDGGEPERVRGDRNRWTLRFTESPGAYRFKGGNESVRSLGFSINVAESESNLEELSDEAFDELLGADHYRLAQNPDELRREQGTERRGQSFYGLLVLLLPWLLAAEYLFASRFHAPSRSVASSASSELGKAGGT